MKAKLLGLLLVVLICAASARSQVWETGVGRLVPGTMNGVDATNDLTLNLTLQRGFFLTGTIHVPLNENIGNICAVSTTTSTCFEANFTTSSPLPSGFTVTYSVVVPPDTYNLQILFFEAEGQNGPPTQFTYIDPTSPAPFAVSSDTTRNLTIPCVSESTITGSVSNLNPAFSSGVVTFDSKTIPGFSDVQTHGDLSANGSYSAYLPSGTFDVQLTQTQAVGLSDSYVTSDLGPFVVSGPLNFTALTFSTATLSGTVSFAGGGSLPANANLSATDTTAGPPLTTSSGSTPTTGGYSFTLGTGDTYALSLQGAQGIPVQILPSPAPPAYFTPPPVQLPGSFNSNTTFNPVFQAPSGSAIAVTISGRLTVAGTNIPVPGAVVSAWGNQIIGAPYTSGGGGATTDHNGNFSFILPAGTNYTLGFYGTLRAQGDFDGDGKTDFAIWRPSTGQWFIIPSSNPGAPIVQSWGLNGDIPVPGDYDADGITDFAVWRPSSGQWFVIPSSAPTTPIVTSWGLPGDIPVQKPIGY